MDIWTRRQRTVAKAGTVLAGLTGLFLACSSGDGPSTRQQAAPSAGFGSAATNWLEPAPICRVDAPICWVDVRNC